MVRGAHQPPISTTPEGGTEIVWPVDLPEGVGPTAEEHLDYLLTIARLLRARQPTAGRLGGRE